MTPGTVYLEGYRGFDLLRTQAKERPFTAERTHAGPAGQEDICYISWTVDELRLLVDTFWLERRRESTPPPLDTTEEG